MPHFRRGTLAWLLLSVFCLAMAVGPPQEVAAHAAYARSSVAAGASIPTAPESITIWFTEPLEPDYSSAQLLDSNGAPVVGATSQVSPDDSHALILTLPPDAPDGLYTVAWRNLSSADGHSLEGYFGFRIGEGGAAPGAAQAATATAGPLPSLARGLALIGLAMLLAVAPLTLLVFDPAVRGIAASFSRYAIHLRRFALAAMVLSLIANMLVLAAQAWMNAPPEAALVGLGGVGQIVAETRFGQLWLLRVALLGLVALCTGAALWGNAPRRQAWLIAGSLVALVTPLPFSLISHAAALEEGRSAAIASDAVHLLAAALWGGGLFMLVLVLAPAVWPLPEEERRAALRVALPRFSALGLATWGVLLLSGLYAAWLQVGTLPALLATDYGKALILKGVLLLPVLALAIWHFRVGWHGISQAVARLRRTLLLEAIIAVAILLVVGRLIALEPARDVFASKSPTGLTVPLTFTGRNATREGVLGIAPGAVGDNSFTLTIPGEPLPEKSEAVIRFALVGQEIGQQEIKVPATSTNTFAVQASELSLVGEWRLEVIVRKIGSFSWSAPATVAIAATPPPAPVDNPPPLFLPLAVVAMIAMALGLLGLSAALALRENASTWRRNLALAGGAAFVIGAIALVNWRIPPVIAAVMPSDVVATPQTAPATAVATPHHHQATFVPQVAAAGTPVTKNGMIAVLELVPGEQGTQTITVRVRDSTGEPLRRASVVISAEMSGMGGKSSVKTLEEADGTYVAAAVPFTMPGEWRLNVRISPKGEASIIIPLVIDVSG